MAHRLIIQSLVAAWLAFLPFGTQALAKDLWNLSVKPSPQLGLAFPGSNPKFYPLLARAGIGVVRLSVNWGRIEPSKGRYKFAGLDSRIIALQTLGLTPFLTFESTAKWGTRPETRKVKNASPNRMQDWTNFVAQVTERYDGDGRQDAPGLLRPVNFFQVANEFVSPDNKSGGWAGTNSELQTYVKASYTAVKSAHPKATFVLGGIAAFNLDVALVATGRANFKVQQFWSRTSKTVLTPSDTKSKAVQSLLKNRLQFILKTTPYDYADGHLYGPEDRDIPRLKWLRSETGKPVLSSECGGPSLDYGGKYSGQAHYAAVLKRNLNVLSTGAPFCLWFGLGEQITSTYGNRKVQLYDKSSREKPGVNAFKLLSAILGRKGAVKRLSADAFAISSNAGKTCIAIGSDAFGNIAKSCNTPAICVTNAEKKSAEKMAAQELRQKCPSDGIAIAGGFVKQLTKY